MGVSIEEYRQRIGCFAAVATVLSSLKVRRNKRNTTPNQSEDFGTTLRVIIRLSCLIALVAAIIPSSLFVLDLTQFADVEKNPGPAQDYKFHLISADDFERFAVTVLRDIYKIKPLLTFSKGPDGGRDAAARDVNIDLGGGNILKNQNLVVQVKHTGNQLKNIDKNVFGKEKKKVKELVQNDELDTYIMFTNYKVPAGQDQDLVKSFRDPNVGAKNVIVIGKETLSGWLNNSPELKKNVIRQYPDLIDQTAERFIQILKGYKEELKKSVDVKAFTTAKEIVESDKGLVFITGVPGSGKTTVAKQLIVHLSDEYDFFHITNPDNFANNHWIPNQKQVFFIDGIDSHGMKTWCKFEDKLDTAITNGAKFVFTGRTGVLKETLLNKFYDHLRNAVINLSDFNLSKDKKQEMLKKHVEMGDNDSLTKAALLKDDMLSHAAEINCPCFPLVASSLGSRSRLEQFFKQVRTTTYDQKFLDQFFKWVQSTTVASDSSSESCESSTSKRPRQESESSSTADNGDNITGSTSESCKSSTPKRPRHESEPMSAVHNGDDITALTAMLSDEYENRASCHHPLPWVDKTKFELDKVYIKLHFMQKNSNGWQQTGKIVDLSHIFDKHEDKTDKNPRRILIEGSPGTGKTTLSLKFAYDWAMGKMQSKIPPVELVLLIKCRDMKGDILEAINKQLFPIDKDSLKEKLRKFIQEQPEKILLVVDGLDEIPEAATEHVMNLLTRKCLRKCYVVATSRQEKGVEVRKYFDTLLEIESYSESDIEEYITRYFDDACLAKRIIEKVKKDINLKTLARNPLNTLLLCVVFQNYDGELPSTVTELYNIIVSCITKRYCEKYGLKVEDSLLETAKKTLGKLAYKGLLEDRLSFRKNNLNDEEIHCTEMGFLTYKEDSKEMFKPDHTYWFLHKTFQEYLSAFYLIEKVKRQELTVKEMIEQLKDTGKFWQVLMFVSGMLYKNNAVHHKDFVKEMGNVLSQGMDDKDKIISSLCELLPESSVDKDMAGIIDQFLPDDLWFERNTYEENAIRILSRILNILCTKDRVNKEVYLKELCFTNIEIDISEFRLICEALAEKLKVRKLVFTYDVDVGNKKRKESDCEYGCGFTAEAEKALARALFQNWNLKELHFAGMPLALKDVAAITAALTPDTSSTGPSALDTLVLQGIECNEQSAFAVAEMLKTNNTLKTLDMSYNDLTSKGVTSIAEALKANRTLNHLVLINTGCDDEGAAALANMLRSNKTLTKLLISNCFEDKDTHNKVGKDGAVALADALRVNNSLKELHLRKNYPNDTNEEFKCLTEALLENTALESLCIDYRDDLMTLDQDTRLKVENVRRPFCYCNTDSPLKIEKIIA